MRLKKLILILLGSLTRIALLAQCDSSISVCPSVFDYLITQDVKQKQCHASQYIYKAEIANLQYQLKQADSLQRITSDILLITNQEKDLLNTSIDLKDRQLKKQARQIIGLKVGCISIGVLGIASTVYFIFH